MLIFIRFACCFGSANLAAWRRPSSKRAEETMRVGGEGWREQVGDGDGFSGVGSGTPGGE